MVCPKRLALIGAAAAALVAGCGEDRSLEYSQRPPLLAEAVPRLERAGYGVEALTVGEKDVPALIARDGEVAAAFAVVGIRDVPREVRDEDGNAFPVNTFATCRTGVTVMHSAREGRNAMEMARAGGLCVRPRAQPGNSPEQRVDEVPGSLPPAPWANPPQDPPQ